MNCVHCHSCPPPSKAKGDSTPPSHRGHQRANKGGEWGATLTGDGHNNMNNCAIGNYGLKNDCRVELIKKTEHHKLHIGSICLGASEYLNNLIPACFYFHFLFNLFMRDCVQYHIQNKCCYLIYFT